VKNVGIFDDFKIKDDVDNKQSRKRYSTGYKTGVKGGRSKSKNKYDVKDTVTGLKRGKNTLFKKLLSI
jgi:hypothetical protein